MVEIFCLRLAFGLIASLLILDPKPIPPRFFRVQFLAALGLLAVAGYFVYDYRFDTGGRADGAQIREWAFFFVLCISAAVCFLGCILWHLEQSPGGRLIIQVSALALATVPFFVPPCASFYWREFGWWRLADNFASAAMLGTSTSAMLLGHSYLISPAMTIVPLRRLLIALAGALALRVSLAIWGLYFWTAEHALANLDKETLLWLSARWLLGILAPLALGWMAWETARIRSTQSATGILYVVVIVVFLGELTSLLLLEKTGSVL